MTTPDPDQLRAFLSEYEEYAQGALQPSADELKLVLKEWTYSSHWSKYAEVSREPTPSPVQMNRVRIKRPESVVDKILRKPDAFPKGICIESVHRMHDALGGRLVVYFLANLPLIDSEMRTTKIFEISKADPPIVYLNQELMNRIGLTGIRQENKESGYASIHYIARLRESNVPMEHRPWIEIQVRTLAEHVWCEIEHILGYKPNKRTSFAVRSQFQIISAQLSAIDEHFNLLYEELSRFQKEVEYGDDDPLNAENLPAVLGDCGLGCAQKEIDGLLKLLNSRGLITVKAFMEVASTRRINIIRNTYRQQQKRVPDNFEFVASLAATRAIKDESSVIEAVKTQIEFLTAWVELKNFRGD